MQGIFDMNKEKCKEKIILLLKITGGVIAAIAAIIAILIWVTGEQYLGGLLGHTPTPTPTPTPSPTSTPSPTLSPTSTPSPESDFDFTDSNGTIRAYLGTDDEVVIPSEIRHIPVVRIGRRSFAEKYHIKSVTIPYGVIFIEEEAFYKTSLTSIVIPNSVTSIEKSAFSLTDLSHVDIPKNIKTIAPLTFHLSPLTNVIIPDGVTSIGLGAFAETKLTSVEIPNSVINIDDVAFEGTKLTSVFIPDSVINIGTDVFPVPDLKVIYGNSGSWVEKYASDNSFDFKSIEHIKPELVISPPSKYYVPVGDTVEFIVSAKYSFVIDYFNIKEGKVVLNGFNADILIIVSMYATVNSQ